jgi:DNA-binding response OmpR family regulator
MSVSRTVLVVEDEADLLFTVTLALEMKGFRVVQTSSGEAALEVVAADRPDAVVLDLRLPGIDGWEVLRRLGDEQTSPPVVLLSAQVDTATASRALALGCRAYLAKPFRPAELASVLEELMNED